MYVIVFNLNLLNTMRHVKHNFYKLYKTYFFDLYSKINFLNVLQRQKADIGVRVSIKRN